ncbi:hypothetical protein DFP72DRAFT_911497 [Ephemerocybe angulata]|uniref:Uncharacterized protein n=1 Tax=Ephemerocybe angulata TaxID=980116 RepID=A0A8H6HQ18_9AGAR|nr:hypothetical protein DFP72DRAFT_911497 [Tulosesus angulatus]
MAPTTSRPASAAIYTPRGDPSCGWGNLPPCTPPRTRPDRATIPCIAAPDTTRNLTAPMIFFYMPSDHSSYLTHDSYNTIVVPIGGRKPLSGLMPGLSLVEAAATDFDLLSRQAAKGDTVLSQLDTVDYHPYTRAVLSTIHSCGEEVGTVQKDIIYADDLNNGEEDVAAAVFRVFKVLTTAEDNMKLVGIQ